MVMLAVVIKAYVLKRIELKRKNRTFYPIFQGIRNIFKALPLTANRAKNVRRNVAPENDKRVRSWLRGGFIHREKLANFSMLRIYQVSWREFIKN
jgi:hypothetical protein